MLLYCTSCEWDNREGIRQAVQFLGYSEGVMDRRAAPALLKYPVLRNV